MIFAYDKSYHKHFAWLSVSVGVGHFDQLISGDMREEGKAAILRYL